MVETMDPTDDVPGIVDYERPDTWPQALTGLFDAHAEILETHGREQHRINMLSLEDAGRKITIKISGIRSSAVPTKS